MRGDSLNLLLMQANDLDTQQGAYIHEVVSEGPADKAGLQGSSGVGQINGFEIPVGGDVIVEADGKPVTGFSELLVHISSKSPGDKIELTILRDRVRQQVTVTLLPRPSSSSR